MSKRTGKQKSPRGQVLKLQKKQNIFSSKESFLSNINSILTDSKSAYYSELRKHWNSYSLVEGCPLLEDLIENSVKKAIDFGLLPLISDWSRNHLYNDREFKYIYNQPYIYPHTSEESGFNFPAYYHIRFIGIFYATAILNKIDIDRLSRFNKSMTSIYSGMIEAVIDNMNYVADENEKENPTNYHWMITEIFSIMHNWYDDFNDPQFFNDKSSYLDYISDCINYCLEELYKGADRNIISTKFIVQKFYYYVLNHYFSPLINDEIRESIEENIIAHVPRQLIEPILKFSLDEAFAIRLDEFYAERGHLHNNFERNILSRLKTYLIEKGLIQI